MKKFFCIMPMQTPEGLHYEAVGNNRLETHGPTDYPIFCAIAGYTEQGDTIRVITLATKHPHSEENIARFQKGLAELCVEKQITCPQGLELIWINEDERVATHAHTFQRLIDYVEDNDELFACMTYGTKPTSMSLMMAVQYAYRILHNVSIECIVYGHVSRPDQKDRSTWIGHIYDMTALVQLDEIVHLLAQRRDPNPKQTIDSLLSL